MERWFINPEPFGGPDRTWKTKFHQAGRFFYWQAHFNKKRPMAMTNAFGIKFRNC